MQRRQPRLERRRRRQGVADLPGRQRRADREDRQPAGQGFHGQEPDHRHQGGDPAAGHRRRQPDQDPQFATDYTANKAKYATTPAALAGFQHLQQVHDQGYENKDFASAKLPDALRELAEGKGAQYPILSSVISELAADEPDKVNDVGLFPIPGTDAASNGLTVWSPSGVYIPKSVTGAKLDAAKKFLAFVASPDGCASQTTASTPTGPYAVKGCTLPDSVPQVVKDMQTYLDAGSSSLALEFLSPVKGPSLEQICVEVGSGIRKAGAGAALYDQDVKKQAQQLGLAGW
jgi:raffinose/stachyose/melibiose transport system substrate-binding protein